MKILKYILGILAVLVLVFFLIGVFKPSLEYDCEIMVNKPVAEAWAVAQDEEKMSEWLPGYERSEHVSGTPGNVGAVSLIHFDNEGEKMSIKETITEIVPNKSVTMKFESDFMDMDYKMSISEIDGKSKIKSHTEAAGNGMVSKSIMALVSGSVEDQEVKNLESLKKAIEENTKEY